jgi:hypothetical protein
MSTVDTSNVTPDSALSAKASLYAPSLEAVAPNITTLVDSVRNPGESWTDALLRSFPFLTLSANQQTQLTELLNRAEQNLPPLAIPNPTEQIRNIVLYGSLALFVWKLLKA